MINNYIFLPDLFAILLLVILFINLNTNHKFDRDRQFFMNKMLIFNMLSSLLSVLFNFFRSVGDGNYVLTLACYYLHLIFSFYTFCIIGKFMISVNNFTKVMMLRLNKIMDILFFSSAFLVCFGHYFGIVLSLDFVKFSSWYDFFNLTYVYLFSNLGIVVACFMYNKAYIMKPIWNKIVYLFPMTISLFLLDFVLKMFMPEYVLWSILGISTSGILVSIYIIYYVQPYDKTFGTLGQDSLDLALNEAIMKKDDFHIIKIVIENKDKLELELGKENFEKFFINFILYINKVISGAIIYKIRDDVIIQKYADSDEFFDINLVLFKIEDKLKSLNSLHVIYKVVLLKFDSAIKSLEEYYNLDKMMLKKCSYNSVYVCTNAEYQKVKKESIIIEELLSISKNRDLNDDKIIVTLQPIYDIKTGKFLTAEALIRMQSEKLGIVFPDDFIYLAEELGIIHDITRIVLNKACRYVKEIKAMGNKIEAITVNISPEEIQRDDFADSILDIIRQNGVDYSSIRLEFIESLAIKDYNIIRDKMNELIEYGIQFYLDDFGSGYSNFDKLVTLPFSTIKFDKSIVWGSISDNKKLYVISEITKIFRNSGFNILYEGIENDEYENLAVELGVSNLQGYKYSKPISFSDAVKFFE